MYCLLRGILGIVAGNKTRFLGLFSCFNLLGYFFGISVFGSKIKKGYSTTFFLIHHFFN
ncbi:hypothetical protein NC99_13660 [Sunxiuqinia dokdonensis]|uniref:Uncharacterized protein n=1 Tax=Sunxiuqinia dokdonensis TaxID=1409788 RepID=A0A0L8VBF3_9BACT|nr:hypothetical protein NC99_13660 [Sunxiuqinia dokdonensis]